MSEKELILKVQLLMCLGTLRGTIDELKQTRYGNVHKVELKELEEAIAISFEELNQDE